MLYTVPMQAQPASFAPDRPVPKHPLLRAIREALGLGLFGLLLAGAVFGWTAYDDTARWVGFSSGLTGGILMNAGVVATSVSWFVGAIARMRRT